MAPSWYSLLFLLVTRRRTAPPRFTQRSHGTLRACRSSSKKVRARKLAARTTTRLAVRSRRLASYICAAGPDHDTPPGSTTPSIPIARSSAAASGSSPGAVMANRSSVPSFFVIRLDKIGMRVQRSSPADLHKKRTAGRGARRSRLSNDQ
jgi:hypothetical protein